jgi:catalase
MFPNCATRPRGGSDPFQIEDIIMARKAKARTRSTAARDTRGHGGELQQVADGGPVLTTDQGIPVSDNQNSLTTGERGPTLLEDFVLREKITHFDHERIPERIVHARGSAAHGYFECTKSMAKVTRADFLQKAGQRTPVFARFSTVAGGAGSVDLPRDVRGFAVKFYTQEGNFDLVGNNIPVFFIQDAMKFPDLIHSVKMEPDRGFPQNASAHDTFWDFVSQTPESMHMIQWVMSDRAIPRSLRMIEGFGIHTFRLVDAKGRSTFVKFHWRPKLGLQSVVWNEAVKLNGADQDFHRADLFSAIDRGDYPEWELAFQLFTQAEADKLDIDVLDPTKLIPEEEIPLTVVGRMVLDRNPDNFFAETEQVAFCPANIVPGLDFSNDPLLQGRLFSYLDTQLKRLGGPNFHQIPVNQPVCPVHNFQRDGHMQMNRPKGRTAYEPNTLDGKTGPRASPERGFRSYEQHDEGAKLRIRPESFADHYSQARQFYISQNKTEQGHIAAAFTFELSKVATPRIREAIVAHLLNVDKKLAKTVADGIGLASMPDPAPAKVKTRRVKPSPALALIDRMKQTLQHRVIGCLVSDGVDKRIVEALRRAVKAEAAQFVVIAPKIGGVRTAQGDMLAADGQLAGTPSVLFDAVAVILSDEGAKKLARDPAARDFVADAFAHLKYIGLNDAAAGLLDVAGIAQDDRDEAVVSITNAKAAKAFVVSARKLRHWPREAVLAG